MTKQIFKGKELTERRVINNILRYYSLSNGDGMTWYNEAHKLALEVSDKTGHGIMNVAGVIAALSPQTSWELNKVYLVRFMRDGIKAKANTGANKTKAARCLQAETVEEIKVILNGNKTTNFFLNMLFPDVDGIATIDRHAVAICIQRPQDAQAISEGVMLTDKQYLFFESCYVAAAKSLGIKALELQAITWVSYRLVRGL